MIKAVDMDLAARVMRKLSNLMDELNNRFSMFTTHGMVRAS